jgi:Trk K+ transport system NAD-binding subunit
MDIVVVGGDALALRVCEDLRAYGHAVTVLWDGDERMEQRVRALGAAYVGKRPEEHASLREAGIARAEVVMALSIEDHRNVQVILRSRDLNANIRIVLRQFNRELGRKIEQNLPNCSVLSRSTHAAATYAAAAVDPDCFYALQFPDIDGALVGFSRIRAGAAQLVGLTQAQAERRLHGRIIAVNGVPSVDSTVIDGDAELTVFRPIRMREEEMRGRRRGAFPWLRAGALPSRVWRLVRHSDPVVRTVIASALAVSALTGMFFSVRLGLDPFTAMYFVVTTMTTTGYGDLTPPAGDALARFVAMLLMLSGVAFTGMFVAVVASRLTRAQWTSLHGLRRMYRRGHFVVCGAGQVGSCVIDFLLRLGQRVVVIEANPTSRIIERSRERHFDLMTGDATDDDVLALCNLEHARGLIALTESDTMNLEAALGARAHNASLPIVMRVNEVGLADSIKRNFGLDRTFGTAALSAPSFAGLAFHAGSRGRVVVGEKEYTINERDAEDISSRAQAGMGIPLCLWRKGVIVMPWDFGEIAPGDRVLLLYPLQR